MWNPFRGPKLTAVVASNDVEAAKGSESAEYREALEKAQMRSLLARTQISMIHESLADRALAQMKG